MALSQLQCLDDSNVNPRTSEAKPEFLYCENQRLALEALLADGREAFFKCLDARGLRGFLSDPELDALTAAAEPYNPGADVYPEDAEEGDPPLSLHYWPDLSDTSVPEMDLGWPDTESYRGVTRATIHTQPPLDGQAHVKEVVRKMIAQAQKVIAVVMDVFTDVDIFRDLLDAGYKRKVSVYILLERTTLPHFLSMCQRAKMHGGHLKHVRVRCSGGMQFHTRSSTMVRGRMGHRFMFIDGDKAVSGSYSFTWMSTRLDTNLVTVISGQAVEAFDRLFRILFATSTSVDLRRVVSEPEPEPDPVPQPVTVVVPAATIARKLYSPKYALAFGGTAASSSSAPSADHITPKKTGSEQEPGNPEGQAPKKSGRRKASKEPMQEAPPMHPGLCNLEKAYLIPYLPIWPEPDPPKDVIGFINIRDTNRPTQVHLQRSEMFEVSQAIRFKSPVSIPTDTLPDLAQPRQFTVELEKLNNLPQDKTAQSLPDTKFGNTKSAKEPERELNGPELKCQLVKGSLNTEEVQSNTTSSQDANHGSGSLFNEHSLPQTVPVMPTKDLVKDRAEGRTSSNSELVNGTLHQKLNNPHSPSPLSGRSDSNTGRDAQIQLPQKDSNPQVDRRRNLSGMAQSTENLTTKTTRSPLPMTTVNSQPLASVTLTSLSVNAATTADRITGTASSSTTLTPKYPPPSSPSPSPSLTSAPPIPKPRTIQLFIEDSTISEGQRQLQRYTRSLPSAMATQDKSSEKEPEIPPGQQSSLGSKDNVSSETSVEAPEPKQSGSSQEPQVKEGLKTNKESLSGVVITDTAKAQSLNFPAKSQKEETLKPLDCKAATKSMQKGSKSFELPEAITENNRSATQHKTFFLSAQNPQRILYSSSTSTKADELSPLTSPKSSTATPGSAATGHAKANSQFPATRRAGSIMSATNAQLVPKTRQATNNLEKLASAHPSDTHKKEAFSATAEKETRLLSPVTTPDFQSPTTDISDGYVSALSTASDEFYECSDSLLSPLRDNVFDPHNGAKEGSAGFMRTGSPNVSSVQNNKGKTVSRPASGSSSSRPLTETDKKKAFDITDKMWKEMDAIATKARVSDRRAEEDVRKSHTTADHFKRVKALAESKSMEAQLQASTRRRLLSQSKADKGGVFGETTGEKAEPKKFTGDPRLRRAPSLGERLDKVPSRPSSFERKGKSPTAKDGQKPSPTPPRSPRGQQPEGGTASTSKPPRPRSRPTVLSDGKAPHQDGSSPPHRLAARPPPLTSSPSVGRKQQADVSHGQQSPVSRQPPVSLGRQAAQTPNHSKPATPLSPQHSSPPKNPPAASEQAGDQDVGKSQFGLYLKMYNFKALKDKMSKTPTYNKKGSGGGSSPGTQTRKSSS